MNTDGAPDAVEATDATDATDAIDLRPAMFVPSVLVSKRGWICTACGATTDVCAAYFCDVCQTPSALRRRSSGEKRAHEKEHDRFQSALPTRAAPDPVDRLDDLGRARALRALRRERRFSDADIRDLYDPARDGFEDGEFGFGMGPMGDGDENLDDPIGGDPEDVDDVEPFLPVRAGNVVADPLPRLDTGIDGLNRMLDSKDGAGGHLGKVITVAGDPGVGKSTLLQQVCAKVAARERALVLYASAEQPSTDIREALERFKLWTPRVKKYLRICGQEIDRSDDIDALSAYIRKKRPILAVADALQEYRTERRVGDPGERSQVLYVAESLVHACAESGTLLFLVGHIRKDRQQAGPPKIEHKVHATVMLEHGAFKKGLEWHRLDAPPEDGSASLVRGFMKKNRGGARTSAFFRMTERGLLDFDPRDAVASEDGVSRSSRARRGGGDRRERR